MPNICGMVSSTAQRLVAVRVSGARGELAQMGKAWALNVTLATTANGRSFGTLWEHTWELFLSTKSLDRENGEAGIL